MRHSHKNAAKIAVLAFCGLTGANGLFAQNAEPKSEIQAPEAPGKETGMPPRATPSDFPSHAQAGMVTIGADFTGHFTATPEQTLSTDDYVVVEIGFFGAPEAKLTLSLDDFSLRINGKKTPLPAQPYGLVVKTLKDPEKEPPSKDSKAGKTSVGTGGGGEGDSTPAPVKVPIEVRRAMAQRVQKASLPEGERALPVAGLIYFSYGGKAKNINSIELIYSGPAGNATIALHQ